MRHVACRKEAADLQRRILMKIYAIIGSLAAASLALTSAAYADDATCKDGTSSRSGRGACSHHGGVAKMVGCKDGTTSVSGRGACSHHGGVGKETERAERAERAEPAHETRPSSRVEPPRTEAPRSEAPSSERVEGVDRNSAGATARCKDGEYSHALHHTGACSRHGGVATWLVK
jgi:hypothetical protein